MRKRYKIFLAFLLVFTMIVSMGTSGFAGYTELEVEAEENLIEDQGGLEEPQEEVEDQPEGEEPEVEGETADEDEGEAADEDEGESTADEGEGTEETKIEETEESEEETEESEEETSLTVTHILGEAAEGIQEIISIDILEELEIDKVYLIDELKLEDEGLTLLNDPLQEFIVQKGANKLNLFYAIKKENSEDLEETEEEEVVIEYTGLRINHIIRFLDEDDDVMTEEIEGLEVGTLVYSSDYVVYYEGINFVESEVEDLQLVNESNTLNLYYELEEHEELGEAPDFLPGESIREAFPYVEEFRPGELGPFLEIEEMPRMRLFNILSSNNPAVKNGTTASYSDEANNKTWPEPGSLQINKTGSIVPGTGNQFEVKLEVEGKNKTETSDIVLVIDRSGSMNSGGRMTNAKAAAVSFVNTVLSDPNNTSTRIALVSFAGSASIDETFKGYSDKGDLILAINGLNANGGTHIQAGIKQGNALLTGSSAVHKSIVFLGDGAATYSYKPDNPNGNLEFWKNQSSRDYYRTTSAISSFNYGSTVGSGSNEYQQYESGGSTWFGTAYSNNYRHGAHAIAEAGFAPANHNIYTIALGAGPEGEWTLDNMQNSGYYSTPDPTHLNTIYQEIAGTISNAAKNAVVTDPLEGMYDILGINASNYSSLISVSHGSLSYDTNTDTINWNIGTITEGTVYTMTYKVALDYSADGGVFYPANKPTYIEYTNIDDEDAKKYFPIPEFRLRALTLTKTVTNGSGDQEFDIILEGPAGPYSKTWAVSLKNNESKTIKGLLPGSYTLKEIVPMNYELVSISNITIGEDDWVLSSTVTNKKSNDGWFHDDDELVNTFRVGQVGGVYPSSGSLPNERKLYAKLDYFLIPSSIEQNNGDKA